MDDYRESIWGIRPQDRKWFQSFTMAGGFVGSVILAILELGSNSTVASPSEIARNMVLGIGASFVASGFAVWGVLQARDLMSALADWIREATRKRRERWMEEGRQAGHQSGIEEGRQLGREEALREIYGEGYSDSQRDSGPSSPDDHDTNGTESGNGSR